MSLAEQAKEDSRPDAASGESRDKRDHVAGDAVDGQEGRRDGFYKGNRDDNRERRGRGRGRGNSSTYRRGGYRKRDNSGRDYSGDEADRPNGAEKGNGEASPQSNDGRQEGQYDGRRRRPRNNGGRFRKPRNRTASGGSGNEANAGDVSGEASDGNKLLEPRESNRGGRGYRRNRRFGRNRPRVEGEAEEGTQNQAWNRRFNNRFTHFVSIPLNTEPIKEKFLNLKSQILERWANSEDLFISEDLFQNPAKIHLTFGVMNLKDEKEEELASDLLNKCKENIIAPILNGQPLVLELKGLDTLPDRRSGKPRVAFARIGAGRDKLQAIADQVVNCFTENGIMKESEKDQVKLHITLMNTTFRHRAFRRRPQFWTLMKPPNYFDATPILEQFSDYEFAESFPVKGLHISSATKFTEDGFYEPLTQLDF